MYLGNFLFINSNRTKNLSYQCVIPNLPKVGNLVGVQEPLDRPFKSAVAKIENVLLVLNPTKLGAYQNEVLIVALLLVQSETALTVEALSL